MNFDVGVILSSQTDFVFMEMVNLSVGAKRVYDTIETIRYGCKCGIDHSQDNSRETMQEVLNRCFKDPLKGTRILFDAAERYPESLNTDILRDLMDDIEEQLDEQRSWN